MIAHKTRLFYILSLTVLMVLSAYPLINGVRMAIISIANGALEPEQYVKYVVPYAAICASILFFTALLPLFQKLKRLTFPLGLGLAFCMFILVELFFETMQIHTSGMTLVDASTLSLVPVQGDTTADSWQAALCIASPDLRGQALTYASQDSFFYIIGNTAYKVHYYLISLILITMVCGLVYGIAKMLRSNDQSQKSPLFLRSVSTAGLVAMCIFANTTAFFRQFAPIQTPLASILTGLFFIMLGAAVGIYVGSYLFRKGKGLGIGIPVLLSLCVTVLMYVGEAVMMQGNLYRFGTGWFFSGLSGIVLALVDILIILLSGLVVWLVLSMTRKQGHGAGKPVMIVAFSLCIAVAAIGPLISLSAPKNSDDSILGCYVPDKNIYASFLSSSVFAVGESFFVYGLNETAFIVANARSGSIQSYDVEYCKTPVRLEDLSAVINSPSFTPFSPSYLAGFKECFLLAVITDGNVTKYGLYRVGSELFHQ